MGKLVCIFVAIVLSGIIGYLIPIELLWLSVLLSGVLGATAAITGMIIDGDI